MSQYTSYYLYQKYEKIGEQEWQPCYPNIYSISGDSEIVMPLVMKSSADTACGYIPPSEPIYRWVNLDPSVDYYCSGTTKYYKQQRQVSYNSGQTWTDVVPAEYQWGSSAQTHSTDCGAIITYRWVNLDPTTDWYCSGTTKYYKQQRQISYNGGQTWENVVPPEYQWGNSAQTQSEDCGYVPPIYRWVNMDISSNWICDECTPIEPIYRWEAAPASDYMCSGTSKYYKEYFEVSHDSGQTWEHVVPEQTRRGDLIEAQSEDCGYVPPTPPSGYSNQYLTFVARENGRFKFSGNSVDYSLDSGATWTTLASNTNSPTVQSGNSIMWKGTLSPAIDRGIGKFRSSAKFDVEGNPMSLLFGDNFSGQTSLSGKTSAFYNLFSGNTNVVSAENLALNATTLVYACYEYMFQGCTSLTTAPQLPATTLANHCYDFMFYNCRSLTTAPELPATTLASYCYHTMFYNCTSLTTAPELPATTLDVGCYYGMFNGCTSLTKAPTVLPATTLAENCYYNMFYGCTSLTEASQLPATTLARGCYSAMFSHCTSLTTAPELPATTLAEDCYWSMFQYCSRLNYIKCLATSISSSYSTTVWVEGVASSGTFVKASSASWPSGISGIPKNWTVQDA